MPPELPDTASTGDLRLTQAAAEAMRDQLPRVAEQVVAGVRAEVPSYADPFAGRMGRTIETAVTVALGGFLDLAIGESRAEAPGSAAVVGVFEAAYALGRGEARSGRSMEALLAAYRTGARISWRDLAASAVQAGLSGADIALFAEVVFAYIDELSSASAAGHADELATTGRVRERYRELLTVAVLEGADSEALEAAAERAEWKPPAMLAAALIPDSAVRSVLASLGDTALRAPEPVRAIETGEELILILAPVSPNGDRTALAKELEDRRGYLGPARPWHQGALSATRVCEIARIVALGQSPHEKGRLVDTEDRLVELLLAADAPALGDLRKQVLAPLQTLRPQTAIKLEETLRAWLLHHGRREPIAAQLFIHPQTVRYRVQQLRDCFGESLEDPEWVLRATVALATPGQPR